MHKATIADEPSLEANSMLVERVRALVRALIASPLGGPPVWALGAGPHVLLGLAGDEAFARLTPLGGTLYGLAFCALHDGSHEASGWESMLLIDDLPSVVEHALVAVDAIALQ